VGNAALVKRLGELERRVDTGEEALVEQGSAIAKWAAKVKLMEEHANDLPQFVRTSIDELWTNQRTLEWQHLKILHMLVPAEFDDPGELEHTYVKEPGSAEPQDKETDEAEPAGP